MKQTILVLDTYYFDGVEPTNKSIVRGIFQEQYRIRGFIPSYRDRLEEGFIVFGMKAENLKKLRPAIFLLNVEEGNVAIIILDKLRQSGYFDEMKIVGYTRFALLSNRTKKIILHKAYRLDGIAECIASQSGQDDLARLVEELL